MQIILTAFQGKMFSRPILWPDETPPVIHLQLDIETLNATHKEITLNQVKHKYGKFEYTGYTQILPDKSYAKIYQLVDIH